jgi:hypothetical protein
VIADNKSQASGSQKSGSTAKIENIDEKKIYQELKAIKQKGYSSPKMKDSLLFFD